MRLITEARALCRGARQPLIRIGLGLGLMVPAGAMMASENLARVAEEQRTDALASEAAAVRAEAEHEAARQRGAQVSSLAAEFRIPLGLAAAIHDAAQAENIAPRVAFGLVRAESSFRTRAVSPVGAVGLTQLLPSTARWLVPGTTRTDLLEPATNLRVGFKYLRHLMEKYEGNEKLALTAYNRGPGTVNRLLKGGRDPDNGYAEKVLTGKSTKHVALMNAKFGKPKVRRRT